MINAVFTIVKPKNAVFSFLAFLHKTALFFLEVSHEYENAHF